MGVPERDIAQAEGFVAAPPGYSRHRPETTLLYQLVAEHYPRFRDRRAAETAALLVDGVLPRQPIRQWVLSLPLALRFVPVPSPSAAELRRCSGSQSGSAARSSARG